MSIHVSKDPPERGQSAAQAWAYVCIDKDGNESTLGLIEGGAMIPMLFTHYPTMEKFKPMIRQLAAQTPAGCRVMLRVYSQATDIEEIK
jgi:hypothetical protein